MVTVVLSLWHMVRRNKQAPKRNTTHVPHTDTAVTRTSTATSTTSARQTSAGETPGDLDARMGSRTTTGSSSNASSEVRHTR